ncbi:MAG TPA: sodium/proton-translocating pyrophosphatase, partial [Dehalococcoidia bacterium]
MTVIIIAIIAGICALLFSAYLARGIIAQDTGTDRMREIAAAIQEGASAFLYREYLYIGVFVTIVTIALAILVDADAFDKFPSESGELTGLPRTAIAYVIGALASASAGYIGMMIAVRANVRTAASAREGLNPALRVAFSSGAVMGITATGL